MGRPLGTPVGLSCSRPSWRQAFTSRFLLLASSCVFLPIQWKSPLWTSLCRQDSSVFITLKEAGWEGSEPCVYRCATLVQGAGHWIVWHVWHVWHEMENEKPAWRWSLSWDTVTPGMRGRSRSIILNISSQYRIQWKLEHDLMWAIWYVHWSSIRNFHVCGALTWYTTQISKYQKFTGGLRRFDVI